MCERYKQLNCASDGALGCVEPHCAESLLEGPYNFYRTIMTDVATYVAFIGHRGGGEKYLQSFGSENMKERD
jgi:hypothetical protein